MTFTRNEFQPCRATTKIHLGKYETDILADDQFDFDGHTVRYAGMEYSVPQLRGLYGDWFVAAADQTATYKSKPAGVRVSHATPEARERGDDFTMEEASEEEAVVGTMAEQKQIREAAASGNQDRLAQLRADRQQRKANIGIEPPRFDSNPDAPPPENAEDVDPEVEAALMDHTTQTFTKARPVHSAGAAPKASPAEQAAVVRANALNQQRIAAKHSELEELDPRKSREEMGGTRHESTSGGGRRAGKGGKYAVVEQDDGKVVGEYQFSGGATVGHEGVSGEIQKGTNVTKVAGRQPVQVGRAVAKTPSGRETGAQVIDDPTTLHESQGLRARQSTQIQRTGNVGIDEILPGGGTGDVDEVQHGDDLETLLPGAAVAGSTRKKVQIPPPPTEGEEIAEIVEGWSTRRNWQKRVEEAVSFYGDWPKALDAICAKESPKVAEQIRSKLARVEAAAAKKA